MKNQRVKKMLFEVAAVKIYKGRSQQFGYSRNGFHVFTRYRHQQRVVIEAIIPL